MALRVRDAGASDVPALTAIKGAGSEAVHRDRLRDAIGSGFRYLVAALDGDVIGFACLVERRPAHWSDANDTQHLPQIVDLQVMKSQRGQGYGTQFIRAMEGIASTAGHEGLYLSVDPLNNPRAYTLYERLGYQPLQDKPYVKAWEFTDSEGKVHQGEDWIVDMVKLLSQ